METIKEFNTVTLTIHPKDLYSSDRPSVIKRLLQEEYVGKCFRGAYIVELLDFDIKTRTRFPYYRENGAGQVDVSFKCKVRVYDHGTIIVGCEIKDASIELVTFTKNEVVAFLPSSTNRFVQKLKPGQRVVLFVNSATHIDFKNVTCNTDTYFHPSIESKWWRIVEPLNTHHVECLHNLQDKVAALQKELADEPLAQTYIDLFYPYKHRHSVNTISIDEVLENINEVQGTYICRSGLTDKTTDQVVVTKDLPSDVSGPIVDENAHMIIRHVLTEQLNHLRMIKEMVVLIGDDPIIKQLYAETKK